MNLPVPAALLAQAPVSADTVGLTHYLVVSALVFG